MVLNVKSQWLELVGPGSVVDFTKLKSLVLLSGGNSK